MVRSAVSRWGTPEGSGSLPLLDRFSLGIGFLFRGILVLVAAVIGPERLTIVVDTLTRATVVIPRTPEITLIAHLGNEYKSVLVQKQSRLLSLRSCCKLNCLISFVLTGSEKRRVRHTNRKLIILKYTNMHERLLES